MSLAAISTVSTEVGGGGADQNANVVGLVSLLAARAAVASKSVERRDQAAL